jgi:hypothetical protein
MLGPVPWFAGSSNDGAEQLAQTVGFARIPTEQLE